MNERLNLPERKCISLSERYRARTDFFFAIFQNCFISPVIQGAMITFAAFRLKSDNDIILLSKFLQFLEKFVAVHVCFIGLFCPNVKAKMSEIENILAMCPFILLGADGRG